MGDTIVNKLKNLKKSSLQEMMLSDPRALDFEELKSLSLGIDKSFYLVNLKQEVLEVSAVSSGSLGGREFYIKTTYDEIKYADWTSDSFTGVIKNSDYGKLYYARKK